MKARKFYYCEKCKNLFEVLHDSEVTPVCCGVDMIALTANTSDGAGEKHVPAITRDGDSLAVQVGSVAHPMMEEHYIEWILVQQGDHTQRMDLKPGMEPKATFTLKSATEPITVYEFCNLHGLWSIEG